MLILAWAAMLTFFLLALLTLSTSSEASALLMLAALIVWAGAAYAEVYNRRRGL